MRLSSSVASKLRISRCGFTITRSPAACALRTSAPRSRKPKWRSGFAKTGSSRPRCRGSQVWIETQVTPREARRRKDASPASERPSLIHHDTPRRKPGASAAPAEGAPAGASWRAPPVRRAARSRRRPRRTRSSPRRQTRRGRPAGAGRGPLLRRPRPGPGPPRRPRGGRVRERLGRAPAPPRPASPRAGCRAATRRGGRRPRDRLSSEPAGGGDEGRVVAVRLVARDLSPVAEPHHRAAGATSPRAEPASRRRVAARWRAVRAPRRRRAAGEQDDEAEGRQRRRLDGPRV